MNQKLVQMLRDQAALEFNAHQTAAGLSLWAKTNGWKGTHEWTGDLALKLRKHVKGILKFLADFAEVDIAWPSGAECPCRASNLPDVYEQIRQLALGAEQGWNAIASEAEALEEMAVDDFADGHLDYFVGSLKRLNRWKNFFAQVGDDKAAWLVFDKERRR